MAAGPLRERVTFQRQGVGVGDGGGNFLEEFADIVGAVSVSAQIRPTKAREVVSGEGVQGRASAEVVVRYTAVLAGIDVGDRMLDARSGATYNVKSPAVNQDQHKRYLTIVVERGGADG